MSWLKNLMLGSDSRRKKGTEGPTPVAEGDFKKMDSGLQYCDLKTGEGASPAKGKRVTVHYTGWLTNGKRFDSSVAKQKPFTFEIGKRRVIKGWDEGVRSMKTGWDPAAEGAVKSGVRFRGITAVDSRQRDAHL